jgi:hypothetical protein
MDRVLRLVVTAFAFAALTGCAAPCDSYCDAAANYIEYCLENGSQGEWRSAADRGGWAVWNVSEKAEYVETCKADFATQLAAGNDVIESECTDGANQYQENADRGFCVDLP